MKNKNKKSGESFFSFKSIEKKLGWGFGILILIIFVMAFLAYTINVEVWNDSQAVRTINTPLILMTEQVIGYDAILTGNAHWALLHSMKGDDDEIAEHKKLYDEAGVKLDDLLKVEAVALISQSRRSAEDKELVYGYLNQLDEINLKLVDLETRAFAAMEKGNNDEAYSLIVRETYHEYKQTLLDLYHKWEAEEQRIAEYYRQRALRHNIQVRYINLSLAITFVLALIIILVLIFKSVVKPIRKLTDVAEDISSGDLEVKVPNNLKKNKSEIGKLANAFDKLLESSHFALKTLVESKMAEKAKYKTFFENTSDAIFIADIKTRQLVDCNKAAEKLMRYSRKELLSMKADELHPKDKLKKTMEGFKEQAEGKIKSIFTEVLTKDKKRIPVEINASIVKIGTRDYNQGIFIELTGKKK